MTFDKNFSPRVQGATANMDVVAAEWIVSASHRLILYNYIDLFYMSMVHHQLIYNSTVCVYRHLTVVFLSTLQTVGVKASDGRNVKFSTETLLFPDRYDIV